jgi:cell division septum initiation protein DivIVA
MSTIESIADTLVTDFSAAVRAASKAKAQLVDNIMASLDDAEQERLEALAEVRRMQEEAARIAAESIRLAERAEAKYRDKKRDVMAELNELRGPPPLSSRAAMRAIPGGKQVTE